VLFSSRAEVRIRVRIRFSVLLVSDYAHILSVIVVTLLLHPPDFFRSAPAVKLTRLDRCRAPIIVTKSRVLSGRKPTTPTNVTVVQHPDGALLISWFPIVTADTIWGGGGNFGR